jgi:hypothetical protein
VSLADVEIRMDNEYGTVMVVSLDDKPLATSQKLLIQCMTIDQLYGWETSEAKGMGGTIRSVGSAPWGVEKIRAAITLKSGVGRAVVCDENGYATDKKTTTSTAGGATTYRINETAPYTVILR